MCCEDRSFAVPDSVQGMIARYRRQLNAPVDDWGPDAWASPAAALGEELAGIDAFQAAAARHRLDLVEPTPGQVYGEDAIGVVLREALGGRTPPGFGRVRVGRDGIDFDHGTPRPQLPGRRSPAWLLVDSTVDRSVMVELKNRNRRVAPQAAVLVDVGLGEVPVVDGEPVDVGPLFEVREAGVARLRGPEFARWSVVDEHGWAWFPDGVLQKYDYHGRPFFHVREADVVVPAGRLEVSVTRGIGWTTVRQMVTIGPGETRILEMVPRVEFDPAASGWCGADLHVHMNYGGAAVCTPQDASRMQMGENLHFMSLLAANSQTSMIYDREALEAWGEEDLPWSDTEHTARMGVEYRNDLLGHFHVTAPRGSPARFATGFEGTPDWPPNAVAADEYRRLGGTIGYCHPIFPERIPWLPDDDDRSDEIQRVMHRAFPRTVEAREVVADAALGLVDSLDVLSNADARASAELYRRLVGAGIRLAATAGSDAMLSMRHTGMLSNPPGWVRTYVRPGGALTSRSLKEAVRRCETIATNGPWLTLDVEGNAPGATITSEPHRRLTVTVDAAGPGAERIILYTAEGLVDSHRCSGDMTWRTTIQVESSTFVIAVVEGQPHPAVLGPYPYAITSPVWIEVGGKPVRVEEDVRWCIRWLDELDRLLDAHGRFESDSQRADVAEVVHRARSWFLDRLAESWTGDDLSAVRYEP